MNKEILVPADFINHFPQSFKTKIINLIQTELDKVTKKSLADFVWFSQVVLNCQYTASVAQLFWQSTQHSSLSLAIMQIKWFKTKGTIGHFFLFGFIWVEGLTGVSWSWVLERLGKGNIPSLEQIYLRRAFSYKCCMTSKGGTFCVVSPPEEAGGSWSFPGLSLHPFFPHYTLDIIFKVVFPVR